VTQKKRLCPLLAAASHVVTLALRASKFRADLTNIRLAQSPLHNGPEPRLTVQPPVQWVGCGRTR
jgi:hypothetical protein